MATVYHALGSKISIVERMAQLIPGADVDLVKPLYKKLNAGCEAIYLNTSVSRIESDKEGLQVFLKVNRRLSHNDMIAYWLQLGGNPTESRLMLKLPVCMWMNAGLSL